MYQWKFVPLSMVQILHVFLLDIQPQATRYQFQNTFFCNFFFTYCWIKSNEQRLNRSIVQKPIIRTDVPQATKSWQNKSQVTTAYACKLFLIYNIVGPLRYGTNHHLQVKSISIFPTITFNFCCNNTKWNLNKK